VQKRITNLEFLIFNRSGACLYHADLVTRVVNSTEKAVIDKEKLIFGLMWGLKSFSHKVTEYFSLILLDISKYPGNNV